MNQNNSYSRADLLVEFPALLSGLALLALLPVGMFLGIKHPVFDYFLLTHTVFFLTALLIGLIAILRVAHNASISPVLSLGIFLILVVIIFIQALPPVTARDALVHHLAVPKWWLEDGMISQIPWHDWSYYPMLLNLAYLGMMKFGAIEYTPFYHAAYLFLAATTSLNFVKRLTKSDDLALTALLVCLSLPICLKLASTPLVDLGLAFYSGVAIILAVDWVRSSGKLLPLLGCGIAIGLALGVKYNALLAVFVILLFLPIYALRSGFSLTKSIAGPLFILIVGLAVFSPWAIKNSIWVLNPVYPLYKGFFGSGPAAITSTRPSPKPLQLRMIQYDETWEDIVLIPFRMILFGEDGNPRQFDGVLSPILLLCFIPLIRAWRSPTVLYLLLVSCCYFSLAIIYSAARVRYMAPILIPTTALAIFGIDGIRQVLRLKSRKDLILLILTVHLTWALHQSYNQIKKSDSLRFIFQHQSERDYLYAHVPAYPLIDFANRNLKPEDCVFLAYTGNEFYLFERCVRGNYDSGKVIISWLESVQSANQLVEKFRAAGANHLLAHRGRIKYTLDELLTDNKKVIWNQFEREHLRPISSHGPYSLWQIERAAITDTKVIEAAGQ